MNTKDYKIYLTTILNNLGKGEVLYFPCPVTGKRCRVLYRAYGYHKWKSREAYNHRLYYDSQISSKMSYANDRFWAIERKIEKIRKSEKIHYTHQGEPTRKARYLESLREQQYYWDIKRWQPECMPKSLRGIFDKFI